MAIRTGFRTIAKLVGDGTSTSVTIDLRSVILDPPLTEKPDAVLQAVVLGVDVAASLSGWHLSVTLNAPLDAPASNNDGTPLTLFLAFNV